MFAGPGLDLGVWTEISMKVGSVAENLPLKGFAHPAETHNNVTGRYAGWAQRGKKASRAQARHWRRVPFVSVLPDQKDLLPANFLLRGTLLVAIVMLVLLSAARYIEWKDLEVRAEASEVRSQSVKRQLAARQNDIEPLQSQIGNLIAERTAAETTYNLATSGQKDWFSAMSGLFSISVSGVDFISAKVKSNGKVSLAGVATDPAAVTSLPNQLSQLAGFLNLQGIQWDADATPPEFTAGFQLNQ